MSSPCMDGEQGFHEALNFVPDVERSNIFRLNHELPEPLPRLDDVSKLEGMSKMHFTVPTELVRTILATAFFFFELDELPIKSQGVFFCKGSVLCSRSYSRDLVKLVMVEFPGARFEMARGQRLGDIDDDDGCRVCGYYRKKVGFSINGLHEMTSIGIAGSSFFQRIGGFPKSVQELLDDQQANSHFGRADHLVTSWPPKRNCYCSPRVKRHIKFLEPALRHKKRRLWIVSALVLRWLVQGGGAHLLEDSRLYFPYYDVGGLPLSFGSGEPDKSYRNVQFIYRSQPPCAWVLWMPTATVLMSSRGFGKICETRNGRWSEVKELSPIKLKNRIEPIPKQI